MKSQSFMFLLICSFAYPSNGGYVYDFSPLKVGNEWVYHRSHSGIGMPGPGGANMNGDWKIVVRVTDEFDSNGVKKYGLVVEDSSILHSASGADSLVPYLSYRDTCYVQDNMVQARNSFTSVFLLYSGILNTNLDTTSKGDTIYIEKINYGPDPIKWNFGIYLQNVGLLSVLRTSDMEGGSRESVELISFNGQTFDLSSYYREVSQILFRNWANVSNGAHRERPNSRYRIALHDGLAFINGPEPIEWVMLFDISGRQIIKTCVNSRTCTLPAKLSANAYVIKILTSTAAVTIPFRLEH